jgi:excisionase family DNA binding protein
MQNLERVITESEAMRLLNVSRPTLWRYRKAGKLRYYKIGGKLGYSVSQIQELLKSCERKEEG